MAAATFLPEIVTHVSAAVAEAPDLAVVDLLGNGMANMVALAVVHGQETRIGRLGPDAVVLLLADVGVLFTVARAST